VRKKEKKAKAVDLPGMHGPGVAPISVPEVDRAAEAYMTERDKRCQMTPREIAAKDKLIEAIHKNKDKIGVDSNGEVVYRYDDMIVTLKPGKEVLKVKAVREAGEEED
jgi:hypothetical protein